MLKDILIKTAQILNRDDLVSELNTPSEETNPNLQNDILRLVNYFNFVRATLYENYFSITRIEILKSDCNRKIHFYNFSREPKKIMAVDDNDRPSFFCEFSTYISVPKACNKYCVHYKYIPDPITDLNAKVDFNGGLTEKIIIYGTVSEFFASKSMFKEAEYYNNKYMYEIFKTKTYRDRRLKSTFEL